MTTLLALCEGNPPVIDELPSQGANDTKLEYFLPCPPAQIAEQTDEMQMKKIVLVVAVMNIHIPCPDVFSNALMC